MREFDPEPTRVFKPEEVGNPHAVPWKVEPAGPKDWLIMRNENIVAGSIHFGGDGVVVSSYTVEIPFGTTDITASFDTFQKAHAFVQGVEAGLAAFMRSMGVK